MIHAAIASYGLSGKVFHGPLLKVHPDFEVDMILERTKNLSAEDFPNAKIVRTYSEILNDNSIDLVIVNTPDQFHSEMCRQALEANKHVVVEKPFTIDPNEAEELIKLAEKKQRVLTVFQNRRFDGDFMTVKQLLATEALGRLVEYEAHFDRYRNYVKANSWREEQAETGVLYDLGAHLVDQVLSLFGLPKTVTAEIAVVRDQAKMPDYFDLRLNYSWGTAILKSTFLARLEAPRYRLLGTLGAFQKWGMDPQEDLLRSRKLPDFADWAKESEENWGTLVTENNGLVYHGKIETISGNYMHFYNNLSQVLKGEANLLVDPRESLNVLRILKLAKISNREKRSVPFDYKA